MNRRHLLQSVLAAAGSSLAGCAAFEVDVDSDTISDSQGTAGDTASPTASSQTTDSPTRPPAIDRDTVVPPVGPGPFPVGTTNIELVADPELGEYQRGFRAGGERRYVDEVLANPGDVFQFDLAVPDDTGRYGGDAGGRIPIVGYVLYPTTADNPWPDYTLGEAKVSHMQPAGEPPHLDPDLDRLPLLVMSHGRGASPLTAKGTRRARYFASHGYVVCVLFHGDRRFEPLGPDTLDNPQEFTMRPLAVSQAVDELLGGNGGFDGAIDPTEIGGVGESYGGATMVALTGAAVLPFGIVTTATDERFRATVGQVSFMGSNFFGLNGRGTSSVFSPHLTVAGSADELTDLETYEAAVSAIPAVSYLVVLEDQGHEFESAAYPDFFTWSYYFLEAHVRENQRAVDLLPRMAAVEGGTHDALRIP